MIWEFEKQIKAFEIICYWRLFGINYRESVINKEALARIKTAVCPQKGLLKIVSN